MKLVIAEKAEVAHAIAKAMCGTDSSRLPVSGNGYTVTAASGHLLELVEPQYYNPNLAYAGGTWGIEDLPIIFRDWRRDIKRARGEKGRKLSTPDEKAAARVEQIAGLAAQADVVINAGDPDDEGQCIVDEILEYIGYRGAVRRVYINDSIEKNIRREFERTVVNAEPWRDGRVAYARAMADMVFGINDTRLLSKRLGLRNVSVGRVQTPVLRMVVERDRAIENHVERQYYEAYVELAGGMAPGPVKAKLSFSKDFLAQASEDGKHVMDKETVEAAVNAIQSPVELHVARKESKTAAPLPFTITQLEAHMSKKYGYIAAETLEATQILRDRYSAITYNRTPSSYLKEEHWAEAPATLGVAMGNIGLDWPLDYTLKSKAFNDSKVTAHHGIIPQENEVDVARLAKRERDVYEEVVKRYALQFLPLAVYDVCEATADVDGGMLVYKAKALKTEGWMAYDKEGDDDDAGRLLAAGDYVCEIGSREVVEKKTTPPKRYTEETLLLDMASASKYVKDRELREIMRKKDEDEPGEHGGIGTSATRHAILETLKRRGFIEQKGKTVVSTKRGRAIYDILPEGLGTIDMTARWYLVQEEIRRGRADANLLPETVADEFRKRRDSAYVGVKVDESLGTSKRYVGTCPRCGKRILAAKNSYQCESNRFEKTEDGWKLAQGCGWSFSRTIAGKKLTEKQGDALIAGKSVTVKGMKSRKTGKTFDARVTVIDLDHGKVEFSFDNAKTKKR